MMPGHIERRVTEVIIERMADVPVVALQEPRSVGTSTVLNRIARQDGATVINLDLPDVRDAMKADPQRAIRQPGTVFIDEYQRLPAGPSDVHCNAAGGTHRLWACRSRSKNSPPG